MLNPLKKLKNIVSGLRSSTIKFELHMFFHDIVRRNIASKHIRGKKLLRELFYDRVFTDRF